MVGADSDEGWNSVAGLLDGIVQIILGYHPCYRGGGFQVLTTTNTTAITTTTNIPPSWCENVEGTGADSLGGLWLGPLCEGLPRGLLR